MKTLRVASPNTLRSICTVFVMAFTNTISDNGTVKYLLLNVNASEPERFFRLKN